VAGAALKENIYGHKKKLWYILRAVAEYAKSAGKKLDQVTVLDFGCGNGMAVSYPVAALGVRLVGVDLHRPSIEYAAANNIYPSADFICGSEDVVEELGRTFDLIICADILEHLDDPVFTLARLSGVHRAGGVITGSLPNGYGPFEIEKFIGRWSGLEGFLGLVSRMKAIEKAHVRAPYNHESGHRHFFTLRSFKKLMLQAGYVLDDVSNGAFIGAPYSELLFKPERFIRWNAGMADKLPSWLVSSWYFTARKVQSG
jgi:2-polyprenyl-3-methyl-5-hydroxy-6-metoxy-1,4-benzoquinol methylase